MNTIFIRFMAVTESREGGRGEGEGEDRERERGAERERERGVLISMSDMSSVLYSTLVLHNVLVQKKKEGERERGGGVLGVYRIDVPLNLFLHEKYATSICQTFFKYCCAIV